MALFWHCILNIVKRNFAQHVAHFTSSRCIRLHWLDTMKCFLITSSYCFKNIFFRFWLTTNKKKTTNNKFYASLKVSMSVCVLQLNSFTFASLVGFFPTPSPLSTDAVCAFCSSNGMLGFSMTSFCVGFRNYITSRI